MKILVTVKPIPNPDEKVKIKPDGSGIVLDNVKMVINPFCEIAVEEALRIKERRGGEVVVVMVGTRADEHQIRAALAMGADRAILVETDRCLDSLSTAKHLAKVVAQETPDLVLLGKQAVDDDNSQVGQILSALLSWPQATFASKVEFVADGGKARIMREVDGGSETIEVSLPAVITTDLRLNEPRYASLPGIMKAKKKELKVIPGSSLGVDAAPAVRVLFLSPPKGRPAGRKVADVAELLAKLRDEVRVL